MQDWLTASWSVKCNRINRLPHVNFRIGWPTLAIVAMSCSNLLRSRYSDSVHSTTCSCIHIQLIVTVTVAGGLTTGLIVVEPGVKVSEATTVAACRMSGLWQVLHLSEKQCPSTYSMQDNRSCRKQDSCINLAKLPDVSPVDYRIEGIMQQRQKWAGMHSLHNDLDQGFWVANGYPGNRQLFRKIKSVFMITSMLITKTRLSLGLIK